MGWNEHLWQSPGRPHPSPQTRRFRRQYPNRAVCVCSHIGWRATLSAATSATPVLTQRQRQRRRRRAVGSSDDGRYRQHPPLPPTSPAGVTHCLPCVSVRGRVTDTAAATRPQSHTARSPSPVQSMSALIACVPLVPRPCQWPPVVAPGGARCPRPTGQSSDLCWRRGAAAARLVSGGGCTSWWSGWDCRRLRPGRGRRRGRRSEAG